jgi:RNA polymerase sigma factor for flagellar operon FliA
MNQHLLYRQTGTKEKTIEAYLPLIKKTAARLSIALPPAVDTEDLVGSGIVGLLEALERYDASRGVDFRHYALLRIKGSMIDELRRLSPVPRSFFPSLRRVQEAAERLSRRGIKDPGAEQIAGELGWTAAVVEQVWQQYNLLAVESLDRLLFKNGGAGASLEETVASHGREPDEVLLIEERRRALAGAIERLTRREKMVLSLYYREELSQKEIARLLKISAARVSQLHARALWRLKQLLAKEDR